MPRKKTITIDGVTVDLKAAMSAVLAVAGKHKNQRGGRKPTCACGDCRKCKQREWQAKWRAAHGKGRKTAPPSEPVSQRPAKRAKNSTAA